jgi:hypothetical protein
LKLSAWRGTNYHNASGSSRIREENSREMKGEEDSDIIT